VGPDFEHLPPDHPEAIAWGRAKRRRNIEIVVAIVVCGAFSAMFAMFCRILTS
jgi:hypothetical protein